jgi:tetratricopeptide (TPR) repeat protein
MKRVLFFHLLILLSQSGFTQIIDNSRIPATTSSKKALQYYDSCLLAWREGRLHHIEYYGNLTLKEDPEFFMMNYYFALSNKWFNNEKLFKLYCTNAVNCHQKLTAEEETLRIAMIKILENPSVNVTDIGKKIVEKYPRDLFAYYGLYFLQASCGDRRGQIQTVQSALKLKLDSAMLYNQLGYAYMAINKLDSAEIAFNKYLEFSTYKPNAYDSKGNYYRRIKEYQKAYDSYMKGYSLDTTFKMPYIKANALKNNILDTLKTKR